MDEPAPSPRSYQPMNINFGLFPPLAAERKRGKQLVARKGAVQEARAHATRVARPRPLD